MARVVLSADRSLLLVVDMQPAFMKAIYGADRVLNRASFLIQIANLLDVPVVATEQYGTRMGGTDDSIRSLLQAAPFDKMSFSCCGCGGFQDTLAQTARRQVVLIGIETHICVSLTAHSLLEQGFETVVCPDGVSSRSLERHKLGMERIRDAGAAPAHTEAVAYEWLQSADHPRFREALTIVKEHA